MAGTQSKGLHLVLYLCCAEPGSPTQITHFGSTTLNFVGSKGQIDTGRRMQQLGELGCSLGCTFSQHCKERWGLFADRLTWIPTPRDERLQFPKQHCHVQQLLPTPSTARGKPRCAPSPASPAHSWGRAVSASPPQLLIPGLNQAEIWKPLSVCFRKACAGWRMHNEEAQNTWAAQPLGQLSPAPGHDRLWLVSLGGLGLNRGGPPPSVGRQDLALALLWFWQRVQWEAWKI